MSSVTLDEGRWYTLPDGERLPSVTTILRRLHSFPLERWKMAKVAEYVARDPELHALAYTDSFAAAKQALQRGPNMGSALHGISELIDVGHAVDGIPEIVALQSQGYRDAMLAHKIKMVRTEIVVVNLTVGYAGRFDRIIQIPSEGPSNKLADVKTSKAVYPEVAMQLGAYANAEYILEAGKLVPMVEVDLETAFVIHIGPNKTELVPLDIREAWFAFQGLQITCAWQDGPSKRCIGEPLPTPPIDPEILARAKKKRQQMIDDAVAKLKEEGGTQPSPPPAETFVQGENDEVTAALQASIRELGRELTEFLRGEFLTMPEDARRDVLALWPIGVLKFKAARETGYEYNSEDLKRIEAVISDVSAKRQLPFPMGLRPGAPKSMKKASGREATKTSVKGKKRGGTTDKVNRIGPCIVCGIDAATIDEKGNPLHLTCSSEPVDLP